MGESTSDMRIQALKDDTARVMADLSALSRTLADLGKTKAEEIGGERLAALQEQFKALQDRVAGISNNGRETIIELDKKVRANPYVFILAALGLGWLLGKLRRL